MRVYKVMDKALHIEKRLCSFITSKSSTHNFDSWFQIAIVSLNGVIVVLQSILAACDWYTKYQVGYSGKNLAPCRFIISKFVADKCNQFPFLFWLAFFTLVYFQYLWVTRPLYLAKKLNALLFCPFFDEKMSSDILRNMVYAIKVKPVFLTYFYIFFIVMLAPF